MPILTHLILGALHLRIWNVTSTRTVEVQINYIQISSKQFIEKDKFNKSL